MEREGVGRHLKEPDGIGEHNNKVNEFVPWGRSSAGYKRLPVTQEAAGSSPVAPANPLTQTPLIVFLLNRAEASLEITGYNRIHQNLCVLNQTVSRFSTI
jgi:hypothetical protein